MISRYGAGRSGRKEIRVLMKAKAKQFPQGRIKRNSQGSGDSKSREIISRGNLMINVVIVGQIVFLVKTLRSCEFLCICALVMPLFCAQQCVMLHCFITGNQHSFQRQQPSSGKKNKQPSLEKTAFLASHALQNHKDSQLSWMNRVEAQKAVVCIHILCLLF